MFEFEKVILTSLLSSFYPPYEREVARFIKKVGVTALSNDEAYDRIWATMSVPHKLEIEESASLYFEGDAKKKHRILAVIVDSVSLNERGENVWRGADGNQNLKSEIESAYRAVSRDSYENKKFIQMLEDKGYKAPSYWSTTPIVFTDNGFMGLESPIDVEMGSVEYRRYLLEMDNPKFRKALQEIRVEQSIVDKSGFQRAA